MSVRWGSQTKRYVPGCSVIVRDFLPTKSTVVETLTPGPTRWKLWMLAWSSTRNVYVLAARVVTGAPLLPSAIVNPGPTVPSSLAAAAGEAGVTDAWP